MIRKGALRQEESLFPSVFAWAPEGLMVVDPLWVGISALWPLLVLAVLTPHRPVVHCRVQLEVFHCYHQQAPGSVLVPQLELCSRLEC